MEWAPEEFGLKRASLQELVVDGTTESAERIRQILDGIAGPSRDIVVMNSAAALWVTGFSEDLRQCAGRAAEAIDSGDARELLAKLAEASHSS